ncbi:MAG TPA: DUF3798 domain-containing protein [Fervidobacterium sp.]|nr:DUF3798 domain-containing protein [Fervidobacterium sp.]HOQ39558.1 DUF3798 domain-containing protein [Fervidobacterium sp.]HPT54031.1 DUF3798 domain-containing protein [Fervidobacterium sp.]HPZ17417.1 DUF3798 domain-containing protein [Fervidobacterium sp.]HQE48485.1 DUF3798 domain-containing protein [Fervidobacterium sp.]
MKKLAVLLVTLVLVSSMFGALGFKIGVVTGTVSQGEDEYRGAEAVVKKFGKEIIHVTYPDMFMQEQETTIGRIVELAYDPQVKAIVVCQGVPGTTAAIRRVKEMRKDIVFVVGVPHEDPEVIASAADVVLEVDTPGRGKTIAELAKKMGVQTIIHYSFPRHMSMQLIAERKDIMEKTAKQLGINFVLVSAPDPLGEQGLTGAQQFILEDVPRQLAKYGPKTGFFSTNCGMQEPLQKAILKNGGYYLEPCCPSPTHGFPGSLGISIPDDKKGDMVYILRTIDKKIVEMGGAGRFATWPVPMNMLFVEAGVDIAVALVQKKTSATNLNAIKLIVTESAKKKYPKASLQVRTFSPLKNYYLFIHDSIIFGVDKF